VTKVTGRNAAHAGRGVGCGTGGGSPQNKDVQTERPIWVPGSGRMEGSLMASFLRAVNERHGAAVGDYDALHRWSIESPDVFWRSVWEFCEVQGEPGATTLVDSKKMPGARWFPEARLNFARNLLRRRDDSDALVFWGEDKQRRRLSRADLYREVAKAAAAFGSAGLRAGDVVAAWMPNMPETVIAMLAAASLGAIFSSCSPDFGVSGAIDRFGQIAPKILIGADGYYYGGKTIDSLGRLSEAARQLPSIERVLVVPYVSPRPPATWGAEHWEDFVAPHAHETEIEFAELPFDHPLYILFSSGTTGVPKCVVHGAGGTLLQHLKEHQLHGDIRRGDRLFYFTTCGWMMWNWLVSGLASGAALLLYDGSPLLRDGRILFDYAVAENITHFGTSARFLGGIAKTGLRPREISAFPSLRVIFSTGSPLGPESFDYVYQHIKEDVQLASISGGTDIVSCFVLGCPLLPVWRGEIQCKGLGMAVEVFDEDGVPVRERKGELVCTRPFPSMPLGFFNDADGSKFRSAYFAAYPNVWTHGDYAEITAHGGILIHGRSDAVLNPGGVRIGTAEIYRQLDRVPEVAEALAIGQEWAGDVRVILFVRLQEGVALDDALVARIRRTIREGASPRHVPSKVIAVRDIPRTLSGKTVELAVREVVHGRVVRNREAIANPEALDAFANLPELQQ
jgi:acetoacetyl-CoA synthetase